MAQVIRVPNQLLAVEARHHAVLQGFFVSEQLTEHGTKLQMVLAQVAQLEQLARYVEFFELLFGREVEDGAVPATLGQIVRNSRDRVVAEGVIDAVPQQQVVLACLSDHVEELFVFLKVGHLLLQVVDRTVEVAGAVGQHVKALVAARLVVEDYDDQVTVDLAAL